MEWYCALPKGRGSHDHGPKPRLETWPPCRAVLRCGRRLLLGTDPYGTSLVQYACLARAEVMCSPTMAWLRSTAVVGRGGLEPPTSALIPGLCCACDRQDGLEPCGFIKCEKGTSRRWRPLHVLPRFWARSGLLPKLGGCSKC